MRLPSSRDPVICQLRQAFASTPQCPVVRVELALAYAGRRHAEAAAMLLSGLLEDAALEDSAQIAPSLAPFVEPLCDLVDFEYPALRQVAAEVLGRLRDRRAVEALVRLGALGTDPFDFDAAFAALLTLNEAAVSRLAQLACNGNPTLAEFSVFVLGAIGTPSHTALLDLYKRGHCRAAVLKALAAADCRDGVACALDALCQGDGLAFPAVTALSVLADETAKDAVQPLLEALRHETPLVAALAADALGEIGDRSAVHGLLVALGDEDEDLRASAARALRRLADARAVPELRLALDDPACRVRAEAAAAVLSLVAPRSALWSEAVEVLVGVVLETRDFAAREAAVDALGRHPAGRERLHDLASGIHPHQRLAALLALADLDPDFDPKALLKGLLAALEGPNAAGRVLALDHLYRVGDLFDKQEALHALLGDQEPAVRAALACCLQELAGLSRIDPLPLLRALLHDPQEIVRIEAAASLVECGPAAVELLGQCSRDPSSRVRAEAIASLAELGEDAVPGLVRFLYDPQTGYPCDQPSSILTCDPKTGKERWLLASEVLLRIDAARARRAYKDWLRRQR